MLDNNQPVTSGHYGVLLFCIFAGAGLALAPLISCIVALFFVVEYLNFSGLTAATIIWVWNSITIILMIKALTYYHEAYPSLSKISQTKWLRIGVTANTLAHLGLLFVGMSMLWLMVYSMVCTVIFGPLIYDNLSLRAKIKASTF